MILGYSTHTALAAGRRRTRRAGGCGAYGTVFPRPARFPDQLLLASDPDSEYAFTFDDLGRVLTVDNDNTPNVPHVVLTSAYDAGGNRTGLSASLNSTTDLLNTYTFDALNRSV